MGKPSNTFVYKYMCDGKGTDISTDDLVYKKVTGIFYPNPRENLVITATWAGQSDDFYVDLVVCSPLGHIPLLSDPRAMSESQRPCVFFASTVAEVALLMIVMEMNWREA